MRPRKTKKRNLTKSEQMARVRNKDTTPELVLRRALWSAGLRYRIHPHLPGTPDLAFLSRRIAVFVDGCFWHGCPKHYTRPVRNSEFWTNKLDRNIHRDRRVDEILVEMGWTPVRVWEHEIVEDLDGVVQRICRLVRGSY